MLLLCLNQKKEMTGYMVEVDRINLIMEEMPEERGCSGTDVDPSVAFKIEATFPIFLFTILWLL